MGIINKRNAAYICLLFGVLSCTGLGLLFSIPGILVGIYAMKGNEDLKLRNITWLGIIINILGLIVSVYIFVGFMKDFLSDYSLMG